MLLSICIPTHNGRAEVLQQAIDSILRQVVGRHEDYVQICVSDNGSDDGTQALLQEYAARHSNLFVLHRFDQNQGGHVNFLKVIEIASGEFCWYLGSDDQLFPGAVDTVLHYLHDQPGITGLSFGWIAYERHMQVEIETWFPDALNHKRGLVRYKSTQEALTAVGLLLMYMSAHVFRRDAWNAAVASEDREFIFDHRHYMHVYVFSRMIASRPDWALSSARLVKFRNYNWSLIDELGSGWSGYRIETTEDLAKSFRDVVGENSATYRALMEQYLANWFTPRNVVNLKCCPSQSAEMDRRLIRVMTRSHRAQLAYWFTAAPLLAIPHWAYAFGSRLAKRPQATLSSAIKSLAPRVRLRAAMRRVGIENGWTQRYDAHRADALRRADEQARVQQLARGFAPAPNSREPDAALIQPPPQMPPASDPAFRYAPAPSPAAPQHSDTAAEAPSSETVEHAFMAQTLSQKSE